MTIADFANAKQDLENRVEEQGRKIEHCIGSIENLVKTICHSIITKQTLSLTMDKHIETIGVPNVLL